MAIKAIEKIAAVLPPDLITATLFFWGSVWARGANVSAGFVPAVIYTCSGAGL